MPNKRISEFNINSSPSGSDIIPIVSSTDDETKKITLSGLTNYISADFGGGKQSVGEGDIVNIKSGFQFLIYGDLTIYSGGTINNNGDITIINGDLINSGGTYNTSGGTINLITLNRDSTRLLTLDVAQSGATIDIVGYTTKTLVKITTIITGDTYFTCSDTSRSSFGDTLIISTLPDDTNNSVEYFFDSNYFLTTCGGHSTPSNFGPSTPRNVIIFTFDGDVWMNTYDNC